MKKLYTFLIVLFSVQSLHSEVLSSWKISLADDSTKNILLDFDDSSWSEIQIPQSFSKIIQTSSKVIWLRRKINLDLSRQYSLIISGVQGKMDIYFNETLVYNQFMVPRSSILLKLPVHLYRSEHNVISIKFYMEAFESGIFENIYLRETPIAIKEYYSKNLFILFQIVFFVGISIFIFSLYFRFRENKDYLYLSLFYLFTSLSSLFSTHFFLSQLNNIYFIKFFYSIAIGLPVFLPVFFIRFFSLYYNKEYLKNNYDFIFAFFVFFLIVIATLINIFYGNLLNLLWILFFIFVFIYATYILFLELSQKFEYKDLIALIALIYLLYQSIDSLIDLNYFKEERFINRISVFIILLIPSAMVLMEIISLQKSVEQKEGQFLSFDILQTRIFSYIIVALKKPILNLIDSLKKKDSINNIKEIIFHIEDLNKNLNDILELSRMEAIEEPESYTEINVKDFLETMLARSNITYHIYVDPDLIIETSLELVNSLIIRLIDFPGFGSFQHIDLIIISNKENQILFKFFLFNKNIKLLSRIYNILQEKISDKEGLWIFWKIIKEIIRILGGNLTIKLFQKKYLFLEFSLEGRKNSPDNKKGKKDFYSLIYLNSSENKKEKNNASIIEKLKDSLQKIISKKMI